jgi:putative heme-binding domain-containing protein
MSGLRLLFLAAVGLAGLAAALPADDGGAAHDIDDVATLLDLVLDADEATARECLGVLTRHVQSGTLAAARAAELRAQLTDRLAAILEDERHPLRLDAALLAAAWQDPQGLRIARERFLQRVAPEAERLAALQALVAARDGSVLEEVGRTLADPTAASSELRGQFLGALGRLDDPRVAEVVLTEYARLEPNLQPRAVELLTQRPAWSKRLLAAIQAQEIDKEALNLNQLRRIATFRDEALQKTLRELYGAIREGRDPNREQVFYRTRDFLHGTPGDPVNGEVVFKKVCAQCHKLYGEGAEVGPDITRNGRNNWEQLLWNVLDPSQVIGPGYQARILVTDDGRTLTGLPVEESDQQVVLKVQGGKLESIPRDRIELYKASELSMMPDQLERQLTPQELADLFSFLAFDRHPRDPEAKLLPGAPAPRR